MNKAPSLMTEPGLQQDTTLRAVIFAHLPQPCFLRMPPASLCGGHLIKAWPQHSISQLLWGPVPLPSTGKEQCQVLLLQDSCINPCASASLCKLQASKLLPTLPLHEAQPCPGASTLPCHGLMLSALQCSALCTKGGTVGQQRAGRNGLTFWSTWRSSLLPSKCHSDSGVGAHPKQN